MTSEYERTFDVSISTKKFITQNVWVRSSLKPGIRPCHNLILLAAMGFFRTIHLNDIYFVVCVFMTVFVDWNLPGSCFFIIVPALHGNKNSDGDFNSYTLRNRFGAT